MARNFGKLPSQLLDVHDAKLAFDFDLACSYRLSVYDNEREDDRFKSLGIMLGGGSGETGGEMPEVEGGATEW